MLLELLDKLGRKRVIFDREDPTDPYLERYFLLFKKRPKWFPFNIFLHHFIRSDKDVLHDHPWNWASLIIKGGYWENTLEEGRVWRGVGSFRIRSANQMHFIELDPEKAKSETWTIFIVGKRFRTWGFLNKWMTWVPYREYLNIDPSTPESES